MANCSSCGISIPDGQGDVCSMCYGDPYYGSDGYYLEYLNQLEEANNQAQEQARLDIEESKEDDLPF